MNPLSVLQFEDSAVDRLLVAENLANSTSTRFALKQVTRFADGLSHLSAHGVDAILLDLGLPDSQGMETFTRVLDAAPETPIIILTGTDDEALGADLVKAGAQDFLPKSELAGGMLARAIRYAVERRHMQDALRHMAWHDQLTGLPNRRLLADRTRQLIALARRNGERVAMLFIDLDQFKSINDTLGHDAGDVVLKIVAERLSGALRKSDTVARLGGDEFIIVAPQIASRANAKQLAEKLLTVVKHPINVDEQSVAVGTSIGISLFPDDGDTAEALLRAADTAMFDIKHAGRDGYGFYSEEPAAVTLPTAPKLPV